MFLVGIFSTPIPYLLFLLCYGVSFVITNRSDDIGVEENGARVLSYDVNTKKTESVSSSNTFHYSNWRKTYTQNHQATEVHCRQLPSIVCSPPPRLPVASNIPLKDRLRDASLPKRAPPMV
ncbi:MAG: hypothetical protein QM786_14930 [Breznakibacter sp.]